MDKNKFKHVYFCYFFFIFFFIFLFYWRILSFMKFCKLHNCMINLFCLVLLFYVCFYHSRIHSQIEWSLPKPWSLQNLCFNGMYSLPLKNSSSYLVYLLILWVGFRPLNISFTAPESLLLSLCEYSMSSFCSIKRIGIPVYFKLLFSLKTSSRQQLPKRKIEGEKENSVA